MHPAFELSFCVSGGIQLTEMLTSASIKYALTGPETMPTGATLPIIRRAVTDAGEG